MRRKLLGAALVVALAVAAGWNFNQSKNETKLNDLALANVEALAQYEDNYCPNGCLDQSGKGCWCKQWYPYVREANS